MAQDVTKTVHAVKLTAKKKALKENKMRVQISGTKEHSSGRETVSVDLPSLTQNETLIASNPYDTRM